MKKSAKKVGVLREWNPSAYSRQLQKSLESAATRYDMALDFLGVEWANKADGEDSQDIEGTLKIAADFDAMILISGVFSHGVHGLSRFAQRWAPKPVVSVGYRLPGVPSLLVDNRNAVRAAANHLIQVHGRKNLLFIRGRKNSHEAEERYLGYRHALRDHHLLYEEKRVLSGDFTRRAALRALSALDRGIKFDGVIAANDDMALAIMSELLRRGLRIPDDVAIIGFDDVPEAKTAPVPLSSLAQPFDDMARHALDSIQSQAEGQRPKLTESVGVRLVTRASCGCP